MTVPSSTLPSSRSLTALRLPIHGDAYEGLGTVGGLLSFDGHDLLVEFQTKDALFGLLRGAPKTIRVPLAMIDAVSSGAGWFWLMPWIELSLTDFSVLTQLPGAAGGRWRARVRWSDRRALQRFANAISFARAENLHHRLQQGLELPPPLPPVLDEVAAPPLPQRRRDIE